MQRSETLSAATAGTTRPRRRRRRKVTARFYRLVLLLMVALVVGSYGIAIWRVKQVDRQIVMTRRALMAVRMRNDQLLEELGRVSSDDYVEAAAREDLGLVGEGETAFVVVKPEDAVSPFEVERRKHAIRGEGW